MLTVKTMKTGRVTVEEPSDFIDRSTADGTRVRNDERWVEAFNIALSGLCEQGGILFPYPGCETTGEVVMLCREQAEHLVIELLKKLNGGEMPDDSAELVDLVSSLGR